MTMSCCQADVDTGAVDYDGLRRVPVIETCKKPESISQPASSNGLEIQSESRSSSDIELGNVSSNDSLLYGLCDIPPWYHNHTIGITAVAIPFILTPALCMEHDDPDKAIIISTLIFTSGIITIMQSTIGSTLPIVQGSTVSHLVPALAILNLQKWKCPANLSELSGAEKTEEWQSRMREIQGAVIFASLFEILLAITGCIGFLTKYITPITVAPAITLIGLSLFRNAAEECSKNYYAAGSVLLLLIFFSQHLRNFKVPLPCSRKNKFPLFQVFPVLLSIIIVWVVCSILTFTEIIPAGNFARVDSKKRIISEAKWLNIPYPFQFGLPTVSVGAVLGMLCGVMTSTIESIGDYYCCSNIIKAPPLPPHALNRGICIEGFGCVLSGIMGTGNASTSYSDNIGMLGITKIGSRRVIQVAGLIMVLFGLVGKAGAVFVSLPDPILGGMFVFLFSLVMSVGISTLKDVNLESSRNIFIISFSIFLGLAVSQWTSSNRVDINTGTPELDTLFQVLLSTGMFVAGFTAFVLDNTISGTDEDRGLTKRYNANEGGVTANQYRDPTYDLPIGMNIIERYEFFKWIPISPTYEKHPITILQRKFSKFFGNTHVQRQQERKCDSGPESSK